VLNKRIENPLVFERFHIFESPEMSRNMNPSLLLLGNRD
jgi:hypothetical protein